MKIGTSVDPHLTFFQLPIVVRVRTASIGFDFKWFLTTLPWFASNILSLKWLQMLRRLTR